MKTNPVHPYTRISGEILTPVIEDAVWAPSVHNTQPWWFGIKDRIDDPMISLHSDVERRLDVADPLGREMLISCGAALFTLRLSVMCLGRVPEVTLLPDPDRPALVADLRFGATVPVTEEISRLYEQIRTRRSHRGAFLDRPVGAALQAALAEEARRDGASMYIATGPSRIALGALTEVGEQVQRMNLVYLSELARWAPSPGSRRQDGVHETAYPQHPERLEPHYPTRDFARGHRWGADGGHDTCPGAAGVVVLLTTRGDDRTDWLTAGQALQRVLLRASADSLSAAFHTQALEVPELREFIRNRICSGAYPQAMLRLGFTENRLGTVRIPAARVTREEY
jgi:hypothetical protein